MAGVTVADKIDRLNAENYRTWKFSMKMLLIQRELWNYVNGTEKLEPNAEAAVVQNFRSKDEKAFSTIALSIDPDQQIHIVDCKTSAEAWTSLEQVYEPKSRPRIMQLKREFVRTVLTEGESMASYLARLKICSDHLVAAGSDMKDEDLAYAMLTGLPESYDSLTMAMANLSDDKFTSATIKQALLNEYERRVARKSNGKVGSDVEAYQTTKTSKSTRTDRSVKCYKCNKPGHIATNCWSKRPQRGKPRSNKDKDTYALFLDLCNTEADDTWLLDSAATHHVCKQKHYFTNYMEICSETICTADAAATTTGTLKAEGKGDVTLVAKVRNSTHEIILKDVLYVPGCRRNLVSVAQIEKKNKKVIFEKGSAKITTLQDTEIIVEARRSRNLYVLLAEVMSPNRKERTEACQTVVKETGLWHERFCHANNKMIDELSRKGFVSGLEDVSFDDTNCISCGIGKSTKSPCKRLSGRQSNGLLELIHSDLCGPIQGESIGGAKYFMTLIDDFSRKAEVHFLKKKEDVFQVIKKYIAKAEREKDTKIKRFRSDNGLEYCNRQMKELFDELGIKHERTCTETPQMNGVAERLNRTIMECARTILHSSKLPHCFWAEAVGAAVYIKNRSIHSKVSEGVPEGVWTGRKPSVKHFKAYGCLALANTVAQGRKKLDPRARPCIMVGYSSQTKGYRLWDPKRRELIQTKHVKFHEDKIGYEVLCGGNRQVNFEFNLPRNYEDDLVTKREKMHKRAEKDIDTAKTRTPQDESEIHMDQDESDEFFSGNEDVEDNESKEKVGATRIETAEKKPVGRPRKPPPRNPYGRKGKPKEGVELNYTEIKEPVNIQEAMSSPQAIQWKEAIREEIENMERLKVWKLATPPRGSSTIGSKWVFKVKTDAQGQVARYKARLVARGFAQKQGIDYDETYAPVARFSLIRYLLALAVIFGWTTRHIDIKCAYLNGNLEEEIYMRIPSMNEKEEEKIVRLLRPIYGLKQSGRNWNTILDAYLERKGFNRLKTSNCVYKRDQFTYLVTYVDDIAIFSKDAKNIDDIVKAIEEDFEARDLGELSYFLGVRITRRNNAVIELDQEAYINDLLKRFGMEECRSAATPMEPGITLSKDDAPKIETEMKEMKLRPYRELIGALNYLAQCTRPDLALVISKLSQFCSNPGERHWIEAKRVLRYLSGTKRFALTYKNSRPDLTIWSDADWGSDLDDRKSFSGTVITMGDNVVDWRSSKQKSIATSTMEAEYVALSIATKEAVWAKSMMEELELHEWIKLPYTIRCDNRAALDFAKNRIEKNKDKTYRHSVSYNKRKVK